MEGEKAYEYSAYIWKEDNEILMPSQNELDDLWHLVKKKTWMWSNIIEERNKLLQDSDKYVLPDYPHKSEQDRQNWIEYRNQLRDLTRTAVPTVDQNNKIIVLYPQKPK